MFAKGMQVERKINKLAWLFCRTDGAASEEPSLLELFRVATEVDEVKCSFPYAKVMLLLFISPHLTLFIWKRCVFLQNNLYFCSPNKKKCHESPLVDIRWRRRRKRPPLSRRKDGQRFVPRLIPMGHLHSKHHRMLAHRAHHGCHRPMAPDRGD